MSEELSANLSKKLQELAKVPKYRGAIFQIEADEKGLALKATKKSPDIVGSFSLKAVKI